MSVKYFIYLIVTVIVVWSLDSVNINAIFKKIKFGKQESSISF